MDALAQVQIEVETPGGSASLFGLSPMALFGIGLAASLVLIVVLVWLYERFVGRHREARAAAARAGFRYHDQDAKDVGRLRFKAFGDFDRMSISHQMSGTTDRGTPVVAFDFCPQVEMEVIVDENGSTSRRRVHRSNHELRHPLLPRYRSSTEWVSQGSVRTGAVVSVPAWLPPLIVAPEGTAWKAFARVTGADVDFESEEFNRTYRVVSGDERFARRFLSATVIDVLLRSEGELGVETLGDRILLFGRLQPPSALPGVALLAGMLREQLPELVVHEYPHPSVVASRGADDFCPDDRRPDHPSGISW